MRYRLNNAAFHELNPNNTIVYFQIPKTGGLAYCQALNHVYGDQYIRSDDPIELSGVISGKAGEKSVVAGYMNLNFDFYSNTPDGFTHITMLRHPISRVVCMYQNILRNPDHPSYEYVMQYDLVQIFKKDLVRTVFGWMDLMGYLSSMTVRESRPCNMLQQSKFNIEHFFTFYGLAEKYDEFLEITSKAFNWPDTLNYSSFNSIEEMADKDDLDPHTVHVISEYLDHDRRFYEYASALYDTKVDEWLQRQPRHFIVEEPKEEVKVIEQVKLPEPPKVQPVRVVKEPPKIALSTKIKNWILWAFWDGKVRNRRN